MPQKNPANDLPDYWSFIEAAQQRIGTEFPDADLDANRVFLSLNRAASTVTYDFEASIHRPGGSTWPSFRLMLALWISGPLSPHEVARMTGMSRAAVSNLSNTLVSRNLLDRTPSPDDGRQVTLSLTPEGLEKIRLDFQAQNDREHEWADGLEPAEQKELVRLLEKLMKQRGTIGGLARR
ncbi:MarR family winged helix-turn-helix transcriptional regulator [Arthrobacter woluwensis]|uniref:MarR family winged helix-turn-helix transcriptional regulator n=1 Tax=Arthrobacter woluwensis TaxID=156980 RepID=UPI001AAF2FB1|nr:MarR family transcriptional regulator [Arthrobacter woluwensis]QTF72591.1 MarR family transcriptional regulator [Arthrobacter woluwensis]